MVARALMTRSNEAVIREFEVAASNTVRHGTPVKFSSGKIVECTAIADNCIGIAYQQRTNVPQTTAIPGYGWTAPAGAKVAVWMLGYGIVPVLLGTGGATEGDPVRTLVTAGGATTATVGGGTGKIKVLGTCMETGVAGDLVGVNVGDCAWSVGS